MGNGDSIGLEIHNSGNVSRILLQMSDEEKMKVKEEDDLVILKALSQKTSVNGSRYSPSDHSSDEAVDQKIRATNHRDLFRSDRVGAAIHSGEDGFDVEMGGQTQAAFEIYENIKDDLLEETQGRNDVAVKDDDIYHNDDKICMEDANQSGLSNPKPKSEFLNTIDKKCIYEIQTASRNPPIVASDTEKKSSPNYAGESFLSSDGVKSDKVPILSSAQQTSKDLPKFKSTTLHEGHRSEIDVSQKKIRKEATGVTSRNSSRMKVKVPIVGCIDIENAKTEFSAADLRRPMYRRKKKKKSKLSYSW